MIDKSDADREPACEVGYRKPPGRTQFVKGKSGNAKGRPKGSRNFTTVIQAELKRRIAVTEDGKRKKITKREAIAKQLVNKAAAGDPKAIPVLFNETRAFEADSASAPSQWQFTSEDEPVIDNIVRRIRASVSAPSTSPSDQSAADPVKAALPDEEGKASK